MSNWERPGSDPPEGKRAMGSIRTPVAVAAVIVVIVALAFLIWSVGGT
jgi:hypothetical protein